MQPKVKAEHHIYVMQNQNAATHIKQLPFLNVKLHQGEDSKLYHQDCVAQSKIQSNCLDLYFPV